MDKVRFALSVVQVIASLFLVITILLQKGRTQSLGAIGGGADTFFSANKARGLDAILGKVTTVIAIIFGVATIAMNLIQ